MMRIGGRKHTNGRRLVRSATFSCHLAALLFSALLIWNPNRERDLAGYRVYVGERSRRYNNVYDVGLQTRFALGDLPRGKTYFLTVIAYDLSGNESGFSEEVSVTVPADDGAAPPSKATGESSLALVYNFPNPFNAETQTTTLRYFLGKPQEVTIRIFDVKGYLVYQPLFRQYKVSGEHTEDQWDGSTSRGEKVAAGLYYCEISTAEQTMVFRIAVVRH